MLTQTLTLILTQIPTLALTLTQTVQKHYFASTGKILLWIDTMIGYKLL